MFAFSTNEFWAGRTEITLKSFNASQEASLNCESLGKRNIRAAGQGVSVLATPAQTRVPGGQHEALQPCDAPLRRVLVGVELAVTLAECTRQGRLTLSRSRATSVELAMKKTGLSKSEKSSPSGARAPTRFQSHFSSAGYKENCRFGHTESSEKPRKLLLTSFHSRTPATSTVERRLSSNSLNKWARTNGSLPVEHVDVYQSYHAAEAPGQLVETVMQVPGVSNSDHDADVSAAVGWEWKVRRRGSHSQ